MDGFGLRDEKLRKIYSTTSGPVAFIDESYRQPGRGERPFYTMSAAIIGRAEAALVRDVLTDISGSMYWHTTEAYRSQAGQQSIREMMDYLSRAVDLNIITVQADIRRGDDNQMSYARNECLSALAKEVTRGSGTEAVRLLVMEARHAQKVPGGDKADQQTLHRLRAAGLIDPETQAYHASPGKEPLLWAPDLTAWSYRRELAVNDTSWFEPVRGISTELYVNGADVSVKRNSPRLPQQGQGARQATYPMGNQSVVVSENSLFHQGTQSQALSAVREAGRVQRSSFQQEVALAVGTNQTERIEQLARSYETRRSLGGPGLDEAKIEKLLITAHGATTGRSTDNAIIEVFRQRQVQSLPDQPRRAAETPAAQDSSRAAASGEAANRPAQRQPAVSTAKKAAKPVISAKDRRILEQARKAGVLKKPSATDSPRKAIDQAAGKASRESERGSEGRSRSR